MFVGINLFIWIASILSLLLAAGIVLFPMLLQRIGRWLIKLIKLLVPNIDAPTVTGDKTIDNLIAIAGYSYDLDNDLFYSSMNAWQRKMGYCRLYDEAAAPLGMIVDSEPIYFNYDGRKWLVEFWKGQYDLTLGCEVGVYTADSSNISIPGLFNGTFYNCASDDDRLFISFILKRKSDNREILSREGLHWWLTAFKLGEFAEPSDLSLDIVITFKDKLMCNAFITGLHAAGYTKNDYISRVNSIKLCFDKPYTKQPSTRTPETDSIIQSKNELMCNEYQQITGNYDTMPDKLKAVQAEAPDLYKHVLRIGRSKEVFNIFEQIKDYLN